MIIEEEEEMSEDRFDAIKWYAENADHFTSWQDFLWLVSEVEQLRGELEVNDINAIRLFGMTIPEARNLKATSTTLQAEIEQLQAAIFEAAGDVAIAQEEVKQLLATNQLLVMDLEHWQSLSHTNYASSKEAWNLVTERDTTIATLREEVEHLEEWLREPDTSGLREQG